jgi:hypothetical protein
MTRVARNRGKRACVATGWANHVPTRLRRQSLSAKREHENQKNLRKASAPAPIIRKISHEAHSDNKLRKLQRRIGRRESAKN